jgi:hypothetical protein
MDKKITVFAKGRTSEKTVEGKGVVIATPVAYFDNDEMGIGLVFGDGKASGWSLMLPQLPFTCYRGMKILELIDDIGPSTLAGCWHAAMPQNNRNDKRGQELVGEITRKLGRKYVEILKSGKAEEDYLGVAENYLQGLFLSRIAEGTGLYTERLGDYVRQKILQLRPENMAEFNRKLEGAPNLLQYL